MMSIFEKELPALQNTILAKEHHPSLGRPCHCGLQNARYRCRSCTQCHLRCQTCIVEDHQLSAWHHLEEWVGTHFSRTSLYYVGYHHRLGHGGNHCPNRDKSTLVKNMVIVHTNGFHKIMVEFCACDGRVTPAYQLVDAQLFPTTLEDPETAFTFELLKTFQKLSLHSKINAYVYHCSLQEMTDGAFVHDVPNRYHEFVRVNRVWSHLGQVRRSGQCHDFDKIFPYRRPGCIAVRCPACPEVHINVDKTTIEMAREDEA